MVSASGCACLLHGCTVHTCGGNRRILCRFGEHFHNPPGLHTLCAALAPGIWHLAKDRGWGSATSQVRRGVDMLESDDLTAVSPAVCRASGQEDKDWGSATLQVCRGAEVQQALMSLLFAV